MWFFFQTVINREFAYTIGIDEIMVDYFSICFSCGQIRPRLHVFGHIHESRGIGRITWHGKHDEFQKEKIQQWNTKLHSAVLLAKNQPAWFDTAVHELFSSIKVEKDAQILPPKTLLERQLFGCAAIDVSEGAPRGEIFGPLRVGEETLVVNASLMGNHMRPVNAPIIIDMDLPVGQYFVDDSEDAVEHSEKNVHKELKKQFCNIS